MKNYRDLIKELCIDTEFSDLYIDHTTYGFFYFQPGLQHKSKGDKRLHQFLQFGKLGGAFSPNDYLDSTSVSELKKLSDPKWLQANDTKSFELKWKVAHSYFKSTCIAHYVESENVVIVGLDSLDKVLDNPGEKYFQYIADHASEGIVVYENERVVYASPTYLQMMDDKLEDLIGKGAEWAFGIIHPEDRPGVEKIFEKVYAERIPKQRYRFRARKQNGEYIWREDHTTFEFNEEGGIRRAVVIAKEISHQVQLEKELVKQEEIYRNLFDNVLTGLIIADKDTTMLQMNDAACDIIGSSRDLLVGRKINDPAWVLFDEDGKIIPMESTPVPTAARTGQSVRPMKFGYDKHDEPEKIKWVELSASPLFDEEGEVDKIVCTFLDVTEEQEAENRLKAANQDLILLKRIIESGQDGLQVADSAGNLVFSNRVAADRFGIKTEKIKDYRVIDFSEYLKTESDWDSYFAELRKSGRIFREGVHRARNEAESFPVETVVSYTSINGNEYAIASTRDITERKRAETKLQIEKERLDNIVSGVRLATWEWDVPSDRFEHNAQWADMLGYTLEEIATYNREKLMRDTHPEDVAKVKEALESHLRGEVDRYEVELRVKHKDGHWIWIWTIGRVISKDESGNPLLLAGTNFDITERKRQEEELRLYESVIKNTKDAILVTDTESLESPGPKIVFVNQAFCDMTGYSQEEIIGQTPRILQGPNSDRQVLGQIRSSLEKWESCDYELVNYKKTGEPFWVNISITPVADETGWFTHWIAVERDVSERKIQEAELLVAKESAENSAIELNEAQKIAHLANWHLDLATNEVTWSEELYKMYGFDPNQPPPLYPEQQKFFTNESWNLLERELSKTAKEGIPYELELNFLRPDDSNGWMWIKGSAIRNEVGDIIGFRGTAQDITERKTNEERLSSQSQIREFLVQLASDFINVPLSAVPYAINNALRKFVEFYGADRAYVFDYDFENQLARNTYEWCGDGISPEIDNLQNVPFEAIPGWLENHEQGLPLEIADTSDDSLDDSLKDILLPQGIKSLITYPMMMGEQCIGLVGFDSVIKKKAYSDTEKDLLLIFSKMLVNVFERIDAENALTKQSRIRALLIELASSFINAPLSEVSGAIEEALGKVGEFFGADRAHIIEYDWENQEANNTYEWCAEGISKEISNTKNVPLSSIKSWVERHQKGEKWSIQDTSKMPEKDDFREILKEQNIKSVISFPMIVSGECFGCIGFDSVKNHKAYSRM
ncbi:MAG: PAS domain S-box protein, partial [Ekhidna sp.]|nr:PAS domain S-box protein [Ekhidna sp.]